MPDGYSDSEAKKGVADELKRLRGGTTLSQADLGKQLGVSGQQIGKYERGESDIPAHRMDFIRHFLSPDVSLERGFSEENSPYDAGPLQSNLAVEALWLVARSHLMALVNAMDKLFGT